MTPRTSGPTGHRTPATDVEPLVLDAADRLVAQGGPAALSIRGLATAAGVAPMSIYNRFGDKAGVLRALFTRGFRELTRHTSDPAHFAPSLSPAEANARLRTAGLAYRRFAQASPGTYSLMFDQAPEQFEPSDEGMAEAAAAFDALVALVAQSQAAGALVEGDPRELAQRIWAAIHGAVSLELRSICFVDDTDAHYGALLDTILIGLAPGHGVPGITGPAVQPVRGAARAVST